MIKENRTDIINIVNYAKLYNKNNKNSILSNNNNI